MIEALIIGIIKLVITLFLLGWAVALVIGLLGWIYMLVVGTYNYIRGK